MMAYKLGTKNSVNTVATAKPRPKRQRRNFSHLEQTPAARILDVPNLIDIQRASFQQFMESGIREVIKDISPIENYTGDLAVEFGDYVFEPPAVSERECRDRVKCGGEEAVRTHRVVYIPA